MLNSRKSLTWSVVLVAPAFTVSGMKGEAGAVAPKGLMIYALIKGGLSQSLGGQSQALGGQSQALGGQS